MEAELLDIYGQLVHNTSAKKQIEESRFLSEQGRKGGIKLATKQVADQYRPLASHQIVICTNECLARGISIFTGSWEGNEWNGKILISTHLIYFEKRSLDHYFVFCIFFFLYSSIHDCRLNF